jgi:hypothetical protein
LPLPCNDGKRFPFDNAKNRPQYLVAIDDGLNGPDQCVGVKSPSNAAKKGDVISGRARLQLVQEPKPLLGKRQRAWVPPLSPPDSLVTSRPLSFLRALHDGSAPIESPARITINLFHRARPVAKSGKSLPQPNVSISLANSFDCDNVLNWQVRLVQQSTQYLFELSGHARHGFSIK